MVSEIAIIKKFIIAELVLCAYWLSIAGAGTELSRQDIEIKLFALKPLPKIHYSWGLGDILNDPNDRLAYELARITHALSVKGEWVTKEQVQNSVYICARVNKTNPVIPCSLAVNFSPWHNKFGKDLSPTNRGPTYIAELSFFKERMEVVKNWVKESNQKYGTDVQVSAILLDSERFEIRNDSNLWNDAIRDNLDSIHKLAKEIYSNARIEWYGRGMIEAWAYDGWSRTPYFTGKEIKSSLSCSLYTVPEPDRMRELFRRTCKLADELGIEDVTPWVALGCGYKRHTTELQKWVKDWDYDLIYSWLLGSELNIDWYAQRPKRYAPYNRAKVIIFYPAPFSPTMEYWPKHFIAYVRVRHKRR